MMNRQILERELCQGSHSAYLNSTRHAPMQKNRLAIIMKEDNVPSKPSSSRGLNTATTPTSPSKLITQQAKKSSMANNSFSTSFLFSPYTQQMMMEMEKVMAGITSKGKLTFGR